MSRDDRFLDAVVAANVYDVAVRTPLQEAPRISAALGRSVLLKREDLQNTFSFKVRGAYNMMSRLSSEALQRGVIAASAGNHAQGVALAGRRLSAPVTIVMPSTTPRIKVDAVRGLGAEVLLVGESYNEAEDEAWGIGRHRKLTFVHAYDNADVIAGQGTIGKEILEQCERPIDAIYVPVGGGGLIAGVASYVKALRPETLIVGVEPIDSDAMHRSLRAGRRVRLSQVGQFADGVAVSRVGAESFRLARKYVDDIVLVDTDEICAAIKDVFEDTRVVVEPSAALSVAGTKRHAESGRLTGQTAVAVITGANVNFNRLRFIAERAELGEHREALFAATIRERPGSFKAFCRLIGRRSITEFNYRYDDPDEAHVFVGLDIRDRAEASALLATFESHGIPVLDLTDNEMAKLHIRHLVGGRANAADELLYRFEFPERPGALMEFLDRLAATWNISLFHYRNHGTDYGRVLAGIQVPRADRRAFRDFLRQLDYPSSDETPNPAYQLFLH